MRMGQHRGQDSLNRVRRDWVRPLGGEPLFLSEGPCPVCSLPTHTVLPLRGTEAHGRELPSVLQHRQSFRPEYVRSEVRFITVTRVQGLAVCCPCGQLRWVSAKSEMSPWPGGGRSFWNGPRPSSAVPEVLRTCCWWPTT